MGFYSHHVLPRLINFAMTHEEATRLRAAHVPAARGVVLEVGIGSGLNLPFFGADVTRLYGVDPSAELLAMARPKAEGLRFPVEFLQQDAASLRIGDECIDSAVMTWSLCSIADPGSALREVRRVLKAGGALIFVEHGLSPDAGVRRWQNRLTPIWRHVAGGCHLNRKMDDLIHSAGFDVKEISTGYVPGPRVGAYMYEGTATRS